MQHTFSVGFQEKHVVEIRFDQFWGKFEIYVDGICAIDKLFIFDFSFSRDFDIWVGVNEKHHVRINKTRPTFFAGFQPHTYMIWIDGVLANRFTA